MLWFAMNPMKKNHDCYDFSFLFGEIWKQFVQHKKNEKLSQFRWQTPPILGETQLEILLLVGGTTLLCNRQWMANNTNIINHKHNLQTLGQEITTETQQFNPDIVYLSITVCSGLELKRDRNEKHNLNEI